MDQELGLLKRQLQVEQTLAARQQYTRAAIRAGSGNFLVWRGGSGAPPGTDYIEIEQSLFPLGPFSSIPSLKTTHNPVIRQQFQCYAVSDVDDLAGLLHLQPTGLVRLPQNQYQPFHSNIQEIVSQYEGNTSQIKQAIYQPLYDVNTIRTAGTAQLSFFQVPLGATPAGSTTYKSQIETNMDIGGTLPYPKTFKVCGLSLVIHPDTPHEDAAKVASNAWFRLFVGTQDYLTGPASWVTLTTGTKNPLVSLRCNDSFEPVFLNHTPFDLIPQQNFRVELNFPVPQQFSQNIRVQAILHGFFYRESL